MTTWDLSETQHHILICNGGSCIKKGGNEVVEAIRAEIKACNLDHRIHTTRTRCNGRCQDACVVIVYPEGTWFKDITPSLGRKIIRDYLLRLYPMDKSVSHTYQNQRFVRSSGVPRGIAKGTEQKESFFSPDLKK
ncbi:(2Fe-2S) ferredoxin domain-containing protein [Thermoactinomyces sp. CICC 10522]|uniref:(2Fe-2S) ferredoxin domain-containing protein n=1 Tax=Thermoactinomyces sp. CICC 10522 TaxID=2767427 RepID=UPI0018DCC171|nr:(2Fe-2S) ferredoxin domain-containing protein [Thermoactinomyces sp. CICC 10522]